jgi:hypothetical protein
MTFILSNNNKNSDLKGIEMEIADSEICLKAFNNLCEELSNSGLVGSEELQYWVFERGYKAALEVIASTQIYEAKFLEDAWATQPSLERDFALH